MENLFSLDIHGSGGKLHIEEVGGSLAHARGTLAVVEDVHRQSGYEFPLGVPVGRP